MNPVEIVGFTLTLLVMLFGVLGSVLPGLPGTSLILLAAVGYQLWKGPEAPGWYLVLVLGALTLLSIGLDFLAATYGTRRMGGTWRGVLGGVIGLLLGIFVVPPVGLLLGPFIGAFLLEMTGGRDWKDAGRAGVGAALGIVVGTMGRMSCSLAMVGIWAFAVWVG